MRNELWNEKEMKRENYRIEYLSPKTTQKTVVSIANQNFLAEYVTQDSLRMLVSIYVSIINGNSL